MDTNTSFRDLIYFDFDKAASICSQFSEGLREHVEESEDKTQDQKAGLKVGIPSIVEANVGANEAHKKTTLETKVLHHDLLNYLEKQLHELGLIADLMNNVDEMESTPENIRSCISNQPYLTAAGVTVIEDYKRILKIMSNFNDLAKFISQCSLEEIKETNEYKLLETKVENIKDRNKKATARSQLKALENKLLSEAGGPVNTIDKSLIDGIALLINTFMPNRLNLRIYPFANCPSFQIICNLKRECFVDQDLEHLLYGYGNFPNVPLGVLGLITSIPPGTEATFDPMDEFLDPTNLTEKTNFERAFRELFKSFDNIEDFMRYSRYPNVTVHPIAVYRHFKTATETHKD